MKMRFIITMISGNAPAAHLIAKANGHNIQGNERSSPNIATDESESAVEKGAVSSHPQSDLSQL